MNQLSVRLNESICGGSQIWIIGCREQPGLVKLASCVKSGFHVEFASIKFANMSVVQTQITGHLTRQQRC